MAKKVAGFCPYHKCLLKAKVKSSGLTSLAKEISKQLSIDYVKHSVLCLLVFSLMKSVLMKKNKLSKEKYKMYHSKRKGAPGSIMELNPVFKELNKLKILS